MQAVSFRTCLSEHWQGLSLAVRLKGKCSRPRLHMPTDTEQVCYADPESYLSCTQTACLCRDCDNGLCTTAWAEVSWHSVTVMLSEAPHC